MWLPEFLGVYRTLQHYDRYPEYVRPSSVSAGADIGYQGPNAIFTKL